MARCGDKDIAEQIKNCFREFDKDGNGAITRGELAQVLQHLCRPGQALSKDEIDKCLNEADKNENGVIEYEEFVDWLIKPGTRVQASKKGILAFDFEAVLKPLFEVFDRNGNGSVSKEEFEECFCILQNAMRLADSSEDPGPMLLSRNASDIFATAEVSGDRYLDFTEFVEWQRKALEKSGLLNEDLKDLVPALARQLQRIFRISEAEERGQTTSEDENLLKRVINNVASFSRDIWNEEYAAKNTLYGKKHYSNRWSEPPVGLNIERLLRQYVAHSRLRIRDLTDFNVQVLCVPELVDENQMDLSGRRWIARIDHGKPQKSTKKKQRDRFDYFVYSDLRWRAEPDSDDLFKEALENLSVDMRFFCLLKTQANFGVLISWNGVQSALKAAVEMGLMDARQHKAFNQQFEVEVLDSLREEGALFGLTEQEKMQKLQETLSSSIKVATRAVMSALVQREVFRVSSKLADVMDA
uniref:EF-hand domain-containing protein n=1 Tax=Pyrodinium bahamense TaxID=73915 RepID=A0A7S0FAW6_9DINO